MFSSDASILSSNSLKSQQEESSSPLAYPEEELRNMPDSKNLKIQQMLDKIDRLSNAFSRYKKEHVALLNESKTLRDNAVRLKLDHMDLKVAISRLREKNHILEMEVEEKQRISPYFSDNEMYHFEESKSKFIDNNPRAQSFNRRRHQDTKFHDFDQPEYEDRASFFELEHNWESVKDSNLKGDARWFTMHDQGNGSANEKTDLTTNVSDCNCTEEGVKRENPTRQLEPTTKIPSEESSCDTKARNHEMKWLARFEKLKLFKKKHGHCNVKRLRSREDIEACEWGDLGTWVCKQRTHYKHFQEGRKDRITPERIDLLNSIGFDWKAGLLEVKWQKHFDLLKKYKQLHGDCDVRKPSSADEAKESEWGYLGAWVNKQRALYRLFQKGKTHLISKERIEKLNSIGFTWDAKRISGYDWNARYQQLLDFKEKYGHCRVPIRKDKNTHFGGVGLGSWVSGLRRAYRKQQIQPNGGKGLLTEERVRLLESIGFEWCLRKNERSKFASDESGSVGGYDDLTSSASDTFGSDDYSITSDTTESEVSDSE